MDKTNSDFEKRLLALFKIEAKEHVDAITSGLLELEKNPQDEEGRSIIEIVFREAHSLKGSSRAVNLTDIESICQVLENVFVEMKSKGAALQPEQFDVLHKAIDAVTMLLTPAPKGRAASDKDMSSEIVELLSAIRVESPETESERTKSDSPKESPVKSKSGKSPEKSPTKKPKSKTKEPEAPEPETEEPEEEPLPTEAEESKMPMPSGIPAQMDTVRIPASKLDSLLFQAEEMIFAKLTASERAAEHRDVLSVVDEWKKESKKAQRDIRDFQQSLDSRENTNGRDRESPRLRRIMEFFDSNNDYIKALDAKLAKMARAAELDHKFVGGMVDNLLLEMKSVLMLPLSTLMQIFPKLVRDLSRYQGKEVELTIDAGDEEIDKRILDDLREPLIHLIRNSIDHGIEKPEVREKKKKPRQGNIKIAFSQLDGNKAELLVSDDGAGINIKAVKKAAVKAGIISDEEAALLDEDKAISLMFQSGVSTSPIITDISGRGLGLAILREKVEKLGGHIDVETKVDEGTKYRIVFPLTLSTFRGITVRTTDQLFVIPIDNFERALRVSQDDIITVENKESIQMNGNLISVVWLSDVLELPNQTDRDEDYKYTPLIVLRSMESIIAFYVDEVLNEHDVVVKSLGKQLSRVRNVANATVLGSGRVLPILHASDLIKSAIKLTPTRQKAQTTRRKAGAEKRRVLVVDDTITSRILIKNILETAGGYDVTTAVDGSEAFALLQSENFDALVSDIQMPKMDGFDLTSYVRKDERLAKLPVILVTGLESREDQERGIDVGADAYIVKSSFDQSNLLEVIKRLI